MRRVLLIALLVTACDEGIAISPVAPPPSDVLAAPPALASKVTHSAQSTVFTHAYLVLPPHQTGQNEPSPQCFMEDFKPDPRMGDRLTAIQMPDLGDDASLRETWKALTHAGLRHNGVLVTHMLEPDYYDQNNGTGTITFRSGLVCLARGVDGEEETVPLADCQSDYWRRYGLPRPRLTFTRERVLQSSRVIANEGSIVRDTIPGDMAVATGDGNLHVIPGSMFARQEDQSYWCSGPLRR